MSIRKDLKNLLFCAQQENNLTFTFVAVDFIYQEYNIFFACFYCQQETNECIYYQKGRRKDWLAAIYGNYDCFGCLIMNCTRHASRFANVASYKGVHIWRVKDWGHPKQLNTPRNARNNRFSPPLVRWIWWSICSSIVPCYISFNMVSFPSNLYHTTQTLCCAYFHAIPYLLCCCINWWW